MPNHGFKFQRLKSQLSFVTGQGFEDMAAAISRPPTITPWTCTPICSSADQSAFKQSRNHAAAEA
jgi:hypothetical protein